MTAFPARRRSGFTLVEVLVSLAIFLIGISAIVLLFPRSLRAARDSELKSRAALLAQAKAEEIRRDDNVTRDLVLAVAALTGPTIPKPYPRDPDLAYSFTGRSVLFRDPARPSPEGDDGVARVVILRMRGAAPPALPIKSEDVLYEHRFGQ